MQKKLKLMYVPLFILVLFISFFSLTAYAADGQTPSCNDIKSCVNVIVTYINKIIPLLIGFGIVVFLWGILGYFFAGGDEKKLAESRLYIFYGIIGIAVMVSVWGLVAFVVHSFDGSFTIPQFTTS